MRHINEREKENRLVREELKNKIEDLKFQIAQLGKRMFEVEQEYTAKYEEWRSELEQIASMEENLKRVAATAAQEINIQKASPGGTKEQKL